MSSLLLPILIIQKIDKRRRTFFWSDDEHCTGAQCLVAWERVCTPKDCGGLGVKNLHAQNICLLLKFCYNYLHAEHNTWRDWLLNHSPTHNLTTQNQAYLSKTIHKHMQMLSQITICTVHNGKTTFCWHDTWLLDQPLAQIYPALYTHHLNQQARVAEVLQDGIEASLRPRLTPTATAELYSLSILLQEFQVTDGQDVRSMCDGAPFSSREAYRQLHAHLADDSAMPLWQSRLSHRIRIFGWLLSKNRLNTRALLARKTIIDDSSCPRCPTTSEDRQHLFITCPAATEVWGKIGINGISFDQDDLWTRDTSQTYL
jgi:hypothetical protein